jgi:hypothetical protein
VQRLNADLVDGKHANAFLSGQILTVQNKTGLIPGPAGGFPAQVTVNCPTGHKAIGGSAAWIIPNFQDGNVATSLDAPITASMPVPATPGTNNHTGWQANGRNLSGTDRVLRVYAVCVPLTP